MLNNDPLFFSVTLVDPMCLGESIYYVECTLVSKVEVRRRDSEGDDLGSLFEECPFTEVVVRKTVRLVHPFVELSFSF